ncbi:MAG TPA: patatin-like phospholipase family protein [Burkholderiales bacterium]|nr:patatin-like phospholipase family protein [Burkholderiales bacterium]
MTATIRKNTRYTARQTSLPSYGSASVAGTPSTGTGRGCSSRATIPVYTRWILPRELLRRTLPETRFEDLRIPLTIITTDLQLGKAVHWRGPGDIIEPLAASLSLPVFFPPVRIGDHRYVDGGVANNVPLNEAKALGARHSLMIQCVCCPSAPGLLSGLLGILGRSLSIAFDREYNVELERSGESMQVHVVQPSFPRHIGLSISVTPWS